MTTSIRLKIKTMSNLFIGGMPVPFEIGGIDQQTALDQEGFPCIPGSSLKGALRAIVREDQSAMAEEIRQLYRTYLEKEREENSHQVEKFDTKWAALDTKRAILEQIGQRYFQAMEHLSPEYLFGIEGFNNTPKLLFSDLLLCSEFRQEDKCFSIDMKNAIETNGNVLESNPRTYKTARRGITFEGEIRFYKIEQLGDEAAKLCEDYIITNLLKFNEGFYRLGNSKSRGYGRVEVCEFCIEKNGGPVI